MVPVCDGEKEEYDRSGVMVYREKCRYLNGLVKIKTANDILQKCTRKKQF